MLRVRVHEFSSLSTSRLVARANDSSSICGSVRSRDDDGDGNDVGDDGDGGDDDDDDSGDGDSAGVGAEREMKNGVRPNHRLIYLRLRYIYSTIGERKRASCEL